MKRYSVVGSHGQVFRWFGGHLYKLVAESLSIIEARSQRVFYDRTGNHSYITRSDRLYKVWSFYQ